MTLIAISGKIMPKLKRNSFFGQIIMYHIFENVFASVLHSHYYHIEDFFLLLFWEAFFIRTVKVMVVRDNRQLERNFRLCHLHKQRRVIPYRL